MIIWGSKARKAVDKSGTFFCPACKDDRDFTAYKWQKYFTLYFIPLFATEHLGSYVECRGCRGEFNTSILGYTRDQILSALAPWSCASCNNVNSSDRDSCVSCGVAREATPAGVTA